SGQLNINNEINLTSQSFFDCFSWIYRSGNDFYLTKFTTSGTLINAISFGEDYPDYLVDVTIDDFQNIYLVGCSDFHSCSNRYTRILKYNSDLNLIWSKQLSSESGNGNLLYPSDIMISQNGKLYVWGYNMQSVNTPNY